MIPIGWPETSVNNYQSTPRNISEERRFQLYIFQDVPSCWFVYSNLLFRVKRSKHDPSNFGPFTFRHGVPSQKTSVCGHTDLRTSNLATFLNHGSSFLYYEMSCCLHAGWKFGERSWLPSVGLQVWADVRSCRIRVQKGKHQWRIVEINLLNPTGHVTHQQFNIQQLYVLPTLYLCVLYLSENKQRLVPLTA